MVKIKCIKCNNIKSINITNKKMEEKLSKLNLQTIDDLKLQYKCQQCKKGEKIVK